MPVSPQRALTESEKTLLPAPLARDIDLDAVCILARWHTPIARALKMTIVRGVRIFWANAPHEATSLAERAHLAHELVHVWQYEALGKSGVELLMHRRYRYNFDPARPFRSYGYEQQAAIVEDYVLMREGARPRWAVTAPAGPELYAGLIESAPHFA